MSEQAKFGFTGVVGLLVGLIVTIMIGMLLVGTIINSVNTSDWAPEAQSAWTSLTGNVWIAFSLLVILPIIIGAVVLLRYVGVIGG